MKEETCKNCKYFFIFHEGGECRKYPPESFIYPKKQTDGTLKTVWHFQPEVRDNGWCGEFKYKTSLVDKSSISLTKRQI